MMHYALALYAQTMAPHPFLIHKSQVPSKQHGALFYDLSENQREFTQDSLFCYKKMK